MRLLGVIIVVIKAVKTSSTKVYKITFDDGSIYPFCEDVVIKYRLFKKGLSISKNTFQKIMDENTYYLALNDSYKYLSGLHSKAEIINHLRKKYDSIVIGKVIQKLEELKLIDELEYAKLKLDYARSKLKGSIWLSNTLKEQMIPSDFIEEALALYTDEEEICSKALEKNINKYKNVSRQELQYKLHQYLLGSGFSSNIINNILEKNTLLLDNIIDSSKALTFQYNKLQKQYSKKYSGYELEKRIVAKLMQKGFSYSDIKKALDKRGD